MAGKKDDNLRESQAALQEQIRSESYVPVYLIMGEQDYLRTQFRDKIRTALLSTGDAMNTAYYTGDQFTIPEIIDLADTMPFLSERRVITIEDSWLFGKSSDDTDALTDYLARMPETTHIVFVERNPAKTSRLYKQIKRLGFILDCTTPSQEDLIRWIGRRFKDAGLTITSEAMNLFLDNAGDDKDMLLLQAESDKLIAYCMGQGTIRAEDVRAIGTVQVKDRIFDMMSAITAHNGPGALAIYAELLQLQTPPQVILALMIRNFNQLLQTMELVSRGTPDQEIAGILHVNPWVFRNKIRPSVRGQSAEALIASLDACLQMDLDYKSGRIDPQLAVEELIIRSSAAAS